MDPGTALRQAPAGFGWLTESWREIAGGFLVERFGRSGSRGTTQVYGHIVGRFLSSIADPGAATPRDVHRFAYGLGPGGLPPSSSTVAVRLAAVSGLYDFAVRMEVLARNPAATVRRPLARQAPPRGLTLAEVARLLAVIPDTPTGRLDRAMIVTTLLTGLRRSELVDLRLRAPAPGEAARYEVRTKGGGVRRRELPDPAWRAILAATPALGSSIAPDGTRAFPISDATFYAHLRRYGEAAGLGCVTPHVLRHTAAKLRRRAGATIEQVSALLGHRSIATTATYLRQLEDERDDGWGPVAFALGLAGSAPAGSRATISTTAGPPERSRPVQIAGQGGCWRSRPVTWRGAQIRAPLPRPEPTPTGPGRERRRVASRRTRRRRAPRARRARAPGELSALRRSPRALDRGIALAGAPSQRRG